MIEIVEGFYVDPFEVKIVKVINDKSCVLYVTGEGAMDGHVLPYPADEVVQAVIDAREEADDADPDEPSEPEEE